MENKGILTTPLATSASDSLVASVTNPGFAHAGRLASGNWIDKITEYVLMQKALSK
jgi:hypothetical protein